MVGAIPSRLPIVSAAMELERNTAICPRCRYGGPRDIFKPDFIEDLVGLLNKSSDPELSISSIQEMTGDELLGVYRYLSRID